MNTPSHQTTQSPPKPIPTRKSSLHNLKADFFTTSPTPPPAPKTAYQKLHNLFSRPPLTIAYSAGVVFWVLVQIGIIVGWEEYLRWEYKRFRPEDADDAPAKEEGDGSGNDDIVMWIMANIGFIILLVLVSLLMIRHIIHFRSAMKIPSQKDDGKKAVTLQTDTAEAPSRSILPTYSESVGGRAEEILPKYEGNRGSEPG